MLRLIRVLFGLSLSFFALIGLSYLLVHQSSKDQLYDSIESIPYNSVGLVLGTSRYLKGGGDNHYFKYRVQAAVDLFKAKKIDYILVSGDNRFKYYNEPKAMTEALLEQCIPETRIIQDYAGRRTFDSVVRAHQIFKLQSFTIISQKWHNKRALFLANNKGYNAIAYNAQDLKNNHFEIRMMLRESAARVKALIDIVTHSQPQVMGKAEPIL